MMVASLSALHTITCIYRLDHGGSFHNGACHCFYVGYVILLDGFEGSN